MADVMMPQLGETVTEGTINRWFKQLGDHVEMDEILFEVSTDKVDSEVPSPRAGTLTEILADEGDTVEVGQVLARIEDASEANRSATAEPAAEPASVFEEPAQAPLEPALSHPQPLPTQPPTTPVSASQTVEESSVRSGLSALISPVVRRLINDYDLDPSAIAGTGIGGRITRADVEAVIRSQPAPVTAPAQPAPIAAQPAPIAAQPAPSSAQPEPTPAQPLVADPATQHATPAPTQIVMPQPPTSPTAMTSTEVQTRGQVVALNNIRKRTAEHMVASKATSPHVLTAMEIDYEGVETVRRTLKSAWKTAEGFSLTYLPFIARALVDALRDFPHLNASFGGDHLVVHDEVNLGVAVDIDFNGLLAPVIKGAEGKRLRQIARDIVDIAARARSKQLLPDELSGGTFTLTNAGQYGTMMQFPIINQPQVAILSTDGVSRKPVVVTDNYGNESIAIHSVGVLAMAWDHRAFDGAYAAAFLHRIKEIIESRDWEAEVR
ncbi:MAG: 2-oxo acid dehydrogenase subunit E2 [Acidimicrobiia bacterium]|nr:2-oxo acid dehydrogenase subunit E2 [Acidimicrobiia bacterium]